MLCRLGNNVTFGIGRGSGNGTGVYVGNGRDGVTVLIRGDLGMGNAAAFHDAGDTLFLVDDDNGGAGDDFLNGARLQELIVLFFLDDANLLDDFDHLSPADDRLLRRLIRSLRGNSLIGTLFLVSLSSFLDDLFNGLLRSSSLIGTLGSPLFLSGNFQLLDSGRQRSVVSVTVNGNVERQLVVAESGNVDVGVIERASENDSVVSYTRMVER